MAPSQCPESSNRCVCSVWLKIRIHKSRRVFADATVLETVYRTSQSQQLPQLTEIENSKLTSIFSFAFSKDDITPSMTELICCTPASSARRASSRASCSTAADRTGFSFSPSSICRSERWRGGSSLDILGRVAMVVGANRTFCG